MLSSLNTQIKSHIIIIIKYIFVNKKKNFLLMNEKTEQINITAHDTHVNVKYYYEEGGGGDYIKRFN